MLPVLVFIFLGALAQTIYPDRHFGELHVANDGRIEAFIDSNDEYWMTSYRQFIELDTDTGELMVAFNVGQSEYPTIEAMENDAHVMITTLAKGGSSWSEPTNATVNAEGYIHGNMVLWYDAMKQQMVMVYQSSRTTKMDEDGFDIKLNLIRRDSGGTTWSEDQDFLEGIANPHIRYQFIESASTNPDGYSDKLIIPVYHLAASDDDDNFDTSDNYEQVVIISRNLYAGSEYVVKSMEEHTGNSEGYFQASIVRVPSDDDTTSEDTQLVAFLRDSEGYWMYRSTSDDDGLTWVDPTMTAIPNPDQTTQAIYLHSGLLMMIYNPSQSMTSEPSAGDVYANCHHLAIGMSSDYGLTWQFSRMLEYAYDGMFNNPVGLQDPNCNNIYLTYSVITDETNGCSMLDDCDEVTQGTLSYIKFTIITEQWVMNDFNYAYDTDNCAWKIPDQMLVVSTATATFNSVISSSSSEFNIVLILSIAVGAFALINIGMCYWSVFKKRDYADLEASQQANDPNDYETTK